MPKKTVTYPETETADEPATPETETETHGPLVERLMTIAYLRSGTSVGGNDEVAREIARCLERGDHERYADMVRKR
jgi:hypothetical protein